METENKIGDLMQKQIGEFFTEINLLIQDVYVNEFTAMLKRVYDASPEK